MHPDALATLKIRFLNAQLELVLALRRLIFCGWQVQPDAPSIQGTPRQPLTTTGAGTAARPRTHGCGSACAGAGCLFNRLGDSRGELVIALNDILPVSIRVLEADEVPEDFHARKSAKAKTYRYRMYRGAICPPFLAKYVWHYPYPLDFEAMKQVALVIEGEHDFTSFAAADPEKDHHEGQKVHL
jgi:tRNA pseudouridine38-40 synthase